MPITNEKLLAWARAMYENACESEKAECHIVDLIPGVGYYGLNIQFHKNGTLYVVMHTDGGWASLFVTENEPCYFDILRIAYAYDSVFGGAINE